MWQCSMWWDVMLTLYLPQLHGQHLPQSPSGTCNTGMEEPCNWAASCIKQNTDVMFWHVKCCQSEGLFSHQMGAITYEVSPRAFHQNICSLEQIPISVLSESQLRMCCKYNVCYGEFHWCFCWNYFSLLQCKVWWSTWVVQIYFILFCDLWNKECNIEK